jgi:hypothetical protein
LILEGKRGIECRVRIVKMSLSKCSNHKNGAEREERSCNKMETFDYPKVKVAPSEDGKMMSKRAVRR